MSLALSYFVYYIIEALIMYYYCSHAFVDEHTKLSLKKNVSSYFVAYAAQFLLSFSHNSYINIISFFTLNLFIIIYIYKIEFAIAIFHNCVITLFMVISELLPDAILSLFFRDSIYNIYKTADMSNPTIFIYAIICKSVYFFFVFIAVRFWGKKNNSQLLIDKKSNIIIAIPLLSLFVLLTLYYFSTKDITSESERTLIMINLVCIFIINIISIWLYEHTKNQQQKFLKLFLSHQMQQDTLQYNKILTLQDEDQKIMIHDIKNHLHAVYDLCEEGNVTDATAYIDNLLNSPALHKTLVFSKNNHLNLLLGRYVTLCEKENITFSIDVQNSDMDFMKPEDITALICNLLDNATESSKGLPDSFVELKITDNEANHIAVISVSNTCRTAPETGRDRLPSTTKQDNLRHGFGTRSMRRISEKYDGDIQTYFDNENKVFHTIIMLRTNYHERTD